MKSKLQRWRFPDRNVKRVRTEPANLIAAFDDRSFRWLRKMHASVGGFGRPATPPQAQCRSRSGEPRVER